MYDVVRKTSRHVHVKRELVFRFEIGIGKVSVHLGIGARDGEADTCQHVVGCHPVNVVLVDLGTDYHAIIVLVFFALALARTLTTNMVCPPSSIFILLRLLKGHVRVY
jgi:hypothetical protein